MAPASHARRVIPGISFREIVDVQAFRGASGPVTRSEAGVAEEVIVEGQRYRRRKPVAVLVLTICTAFVYWVVWYFKINDEARRYLGDRSIRPWRSVAAIVPGLLIVVPPFISIYRTGRRVAQMEAKAGVSKRVSPVAGGTLTVLTCITLLFAGGTGYYYQTHLNSVWDHARNGALVP